MTPNDYILSLQAIDELREAMSKVDYIPVKLGDIVYTIDEGTYNSNWKPFVQPKVVVEINNKYGRQGKELGWGVILHGPWGNSRYSFSKLYKSWWINKEDADEALRKRQHNSI